MRYRTGYYDLKSPDLLKGKPEGKVLEARAASTQTGEIPVIPQRCLIFTPSPAWPA